MEKKSNKLLLIILTVVICVVLLAVMLVALLLGTDIPALRGVKAQVSQFLGFSTQEPEVTEPEETEPEATEPETTEPLNLKSYTVDSDTAREIAQNVVATAGTAALTNSELQVYYQMSIYDFISQYGFYLSYMGVDFSQPLDQQIYDTSDNTTWQEIMIENALVMWHQYNSLKLYAEAEGFKLDEEAQQYAAEIDTNLDDMLEQSEYETIEELLENGMGVGVTREAYCNYMLTVHYVMEYLEYLREKHTPTMEQIEAYYMGKAEAYAASGLIKDDGETVDVRHVLIVPEGGTYDETTKLTTYSEDEWEACRQKAQALLDDWRSGEATEETFAQLAKDHSADGNASEGGLYTNVSKGYMVETFNDWIFDESREYGDNDLVKTQFGYHLMYFVKRQQGEPKWIEKVRSDYLAETVNGIITDAVDQYPIETNYDAIGVSK